MYCIYIYIEGERVRVRVRGEREGGTGEARRRGIYVYDEYTYMTDDALYIYVGIYIIYTCTEIHRHKSI